MTKIILFVILIFFAMFVQTLTGFGGPLLAMPIGIVLLGVEDARPILTVLAFISGFMVAFPCRKDIKWKKLAIMVGVMLVGVILGNWMMGFAALLQPLLIFYGVAVLVIGLRRLIFPDAYTVPRPLQYGALGVAGLMQGLFISGGSFLVLYAVEQLKDKDQFRATVSAVWVFLNIYLLSNYAATDVFTPHNLTITAICIIPELISIWLAHKAVDKLDQKTFLKITYGVLVLSGAVLLADCIF